MPQPAHFYPVPLFLYGFSKSMARFWTGAEFSGNSITTRFCKIMPSVANSDTYREHYLSLEFRPCSKVLTRPLLQLVRHGMRAPDQWFPEDPNPEDVWREGPGQLTLRGKQQQYALGQQLRLLYGDFITSSPTEIEVLSSQRRRCVMSALCLLSTLMRPNEKWHFVPELQWQPIPVYYAAHGKKDPYLGKVFHCPEARKRLRRSRKTKEAKHFLKKNKDFFEYLSNQSGWDIKLWSDVATLYDILYMHKLYHHEVPDWAAGVWDELEDIANANFYFLGKAKEYQRLRAGPLLKLMYLKMEGRIRNHSPKIMRLYSGHSKNLLAVMSALGVFNDLEPPFCATLIWELYQEPEDGHSVRLLYLNSTTPGTGEPVPLIIPGCAEEYCRYERYKHILKGFVQDWEDECPNAID